MNGLRRLTRGLLGVATLCALSAPAHAAVDMEAARQAVLSGDAPKAIGLYGGLVKARGADVEVLAEYAYALGLAGYFDLALANLDRARLVNPDYLPTHYFAARIFELMGGFENQVAELWPKKLAKDTPNLEWIKFDAAKLAEAHGRKAVPTPAGNLQQEFTRGNEMLSRQYFFQATWVLRGVVARGPDHPAPYMGYAIALEKIGVPESAIRVLKKALQIAEKQKSNQETRESLRARIKEIEERVATESPEDRKDAKALGLARSGQGRKTLFFVGGQLGGAGDTSNQGLTTRIARTALQWKKSSVDYGLDLGVRNTSISPPTVTASTSSATVVFGPSFRLTGGPFIVGAAIHWDSSAFSYVSSYGFGIPFKNAKGRFEFLVDWGITKPADVKGFSTYTFTLGVTTFLGER